MEPRSIDIKGQDIGEVASHKWTSCGDDTFLHLCGQVDSLYSVDEAAGLIVSAIEWFPFQCNHCPPLCFVRDSRVSFVQKDFLVLGTLPHATQHNSTTHV